MDYLQAIILGFVQGLTEFLPVSSSAHLTLIPEVLNWHNTSIDFDVFLHFATLLAVIIYFRNDLLKIAQGILSKESEEKRTQITLLTSLIISFLILIPFLLLFNNIIEYAQSSSLITILLLIAFGIPLIFIERKYAKNSKTHFELDKKSSLLIGFAQGLALFSGVSRSGITIMTGLTRGLTKEAAKRYAFLLSIPTISAGFLLELVKVANNFQFQESWTVILVGSIAAFLSGSFAIKILMEYLKSKSLAIFGYYRIILGIILLLILL